MKKKILILTLMTVLTLSLTSCMPGSRELTDDPAGFITGVWNGWIAPLSLIFSFFKDDVTMYEVHNAGFWYDFGFYIAIISGFGGLSFTRKHRKKD